MPQEFTIGIIIHNSKDFLLLRHIPGHWGFLKDIQFPKETKDDTARRIALEHLSLKGIFITKDFTIKESYFYMKDAKWLPYEQAIQLTTFKETKNTLKEANDFLRFH